MCVSWNRLYWSGGIAALAVLVDMVLVVAYFAYPNVDWDWRVPVLTTALLIPSAVVFIREWRLARPDLEQSDRIDD